jgi:histidyl-tRNA synthetase
MLIQTLKGFRDFLPQEAEKRQFVLETLKKVFSSYGFEPLETPALEYEEILLGKYGEEGEKLMYRFSDPGGRRVALRYDQTVPLARVVAQYQNLLPLPFKRYQIQPVWRAENPQKGRYREFLQCDIDIVGETSLLADAQIIACSIAAAKTLGFRNLVMEINDRGLLSEYSKETITTIDKLKKLGKEKVIEEFVAKGKTQKEAEDLLLRIERTPKNKTIEELFALLSQFGLREEEDFVFSPTLARGLDYYTGAIFELFVKGGRLSLGGGGRYDNLIGIFAGRQIPAVGFAFGFDRIIEEMEEKNLFPDNITRLDVLVTIFSSEFTAESIKISNILRQNNINTELYTNSTTTLEKQLKYADKRRAAYVVIVGPEEKQKSSLLLKDMKTGTQKRVLIEEAIRIIKG